MKTFILVMAVLLGALVVGSGEKPERGLEVYPVTFADPDQAVELIAPLLSEQSKVIVDRGNSRLLMVATEEEHRQAAELVRALNVPPRNVFIEVRYERAETERDQAAGIYPRGAVVIGPGGTRVGWEVDVDLRDSRSRTQRDTTQSLLVSSGREGRIRVGERVPYLDWILERGRYWGYAQAETRWQDVGAFLVVRPTILGDGSLIRIELIPELSGYGEEGRQQIRFIHASTDIIVRSGQTVRIGGLDRDEEFSSRFLIGFSRSGETEQLTILLTPTIQ